MTNIFRRTLIFLHQNVRQYYKPPMKVELKPEIQKNELSIHRFVGKNRKRQKQLHVCGLTTSGALGVPDLPLPQEHTAKAIYYQNFPYRLILDNVKSFDCGYGFSVFCESDTVWVCGINTDSQIGFHKCTDEEHSSKTPFYEYVMKPLQLPLPLLKPSTTRILDVSCGRAHSVILTDEAIFTMGNNAFGQCGRRIIDGEVYEGSQKINRIPHDHFNGKVVKVVCGMDHTLFLTEDGRVFACGWSADGQTGLERFESVSTPTQLKGDLDGVKVIQIASFSDTNLALSEDHELFGWGNSEYDQLGCVTDSTQLTRPVKLPVVLPNKVMQVAASATAFALLDERGEVWVMGYGILGKGPHVESSSLPTKIPSTLFGRNDFNPNVKVTQITCGLGNFAAVTNKGELFTWGKNRGGILGNGSQEDRYFPWRVLIGAEVVKVSCGVDHMIIMSKTNL